MTEFWALGPPAASRVVVCKESALPLSWTRWFRSLLLELPAVLPVIAFDGVKYSHFGLL